MYKKASNNALCIQKAEKAQSSNVTLSFSVLEQILFLVYKMIMASPKEKNRYFSCTATS